MRMSPVFLLVILLLIVFVTAAAAFGAYTLTRQFVAEAPIELPVLPDLSGVAARPTSAPPSDPTATPMDATLAPVTDVSHPASNATQGGVVPTLATGAPLDPTRVTILLLGIDQRKGEKGNFRTDTMMVLSLDPARKTGAMLSIPRDIYMQIPTTTIRNRINTAYDIGEQISYPNGAAWLSAKTIQTLLGVKINHYVVINFDVFQAIIDALGPIKVCPDKAIHDDKYPDGSYGYITVDFQPGCQDLDSTHLLQYARVRHNAGDDFGRAERQQEVIKAVRDKALSLGGMSALLLKAGSIWNAIKTSIQTDLTFDQIVQLAQLAQTIPKQNIASSVLTDRGGYLMPSKTTDGEEVFTPVYEKIHDLVASLFDGTPEGAVEPSGDSPAVPATPVPPPIGQTAPTLAAIPGAPSAVTPGSAATLVADDNNAVILVSNGAGVNGLGKTIVDKLRAEGFNVLDPKNADLMGGYAQSVIKVYTGKLKMARRLANAVGLDGAVIREMTNGPEGVDIELIVGKDLAPL